MSEINLLSQNSRTAEQHKERKRMTLDHLKPGKRGKITQIQGEEIMQARLSSIGMIPGATITIDHTALLGDPRTYTIQGAQVSLRNSEAELIEIAAA
jgi:ferrous iron transport protein A